MPPQEHSRQERYRCIEPQCHWTGGEYRLDEIPKDPMPHGNNWRGELKYICPKCGADVELIERDDDRDYDALVQEGRRVRKMKGLSHE